MRYDARSRKLPDADIRKARPSGLKSELRAKTARSASSRSRLGSRRGARAGAGPRLCPALVDRHVAIVDPLLIRPLPAETLLSGQGHLGRRLHLWLRWIGLLILS